jgi:butyryl-CoA dehydrogenase
MNYELTPDQMILNNKYMLFCQREIAPHAVMLDKGSGADIREIMKNNLKKLSDFGYFAMFHSTEYGGTQETALSQALAGEAIAKACPSTFLSAITNAEKFSLVLSHFGGHAQRKKYIPDVIRGSAIGTLAVYESEPGSDATAMQTIAVKKSDGWVINGTKSFVVNASIADVFLILAYTDASSGAESGMSCFILEKNTPGLSVSDEWEKMGYRGAPVSDIELRNCEVMDDSLLHEIGKGYEILSRAAELGKISTALASLGITSACLEEAGRHSKERKSYGRVINRYQEVAFKLSDIMILNDLSRLMIYKAIWARETGHHESAVLSSCAKVFATEAATQAANLAVQIFGGHGYMKNCMVERLYRDAKLGELMDGTSELQRVFIAKNLTDQFSR